MNDQRHQSYLKDMLVNTFMSKHNVLDRIVSPNRREIDRRQKAVKRVVSNQFDEFIVQKTFTQKNLTKFEDTLVRRLNKVLEPDCGSSRQNKHSYNTNSLMKKMVE